jgi:ABC-type sulfate/molybdate transport systems ATPase subunit
MEAQRVALAAALASLPTVLLLDEPFSPLSPEERTILCTELRGVLAELSMVGILATADRNQARAAASTVALLEDDRIVASGPIGYLLPAAAEAPAVNTQVSAGI